MGKETDNNEIWELIGYIKISTVRYDTLKSLQTEYLMPSEIARRTGYKTPQISNALSNLKDKKLVECMNETAHKGRLYKNTDLAAEILDMLDK